MKSNKRQSQRGNKIIRMRKIRNIQNSYRFIVAELDKNKARCLYIAHEIFEIQSNHSE